MSRADPCSFARDARGRQRELFDSLVSDEFEHASLSAWPFAQEYLGRSGGEGPPPLVADRLSLPPRAATAKRATDVFAAAGTRRGRDRPASSARRSV